MTSINDIQRLIELLTRHRLPKEQVIYLEIEQYHKWMMVLKNLGSSSVVSVHLPGSNPELECCTIVFGGFTFHVVQY